MHKIRTLGRFYGIGDMEVAPPIMAIFGAADRRRQQMSSDFWKASDELSALLYRKTTRQSLIESGKAVRAGEKTTAWLRYLYRQTPEYKRHKELEAQLDHEFRREIECPATTRHLSQSAYHIYLELVQEEHYAARKRAFAFTLTHNFSNRVNLMKALRIAGLTVYYTIGCKKIKLSNRHLEIPHVHGLAIAKGDSIADPLQTINRILGNLPEKTDPNRCGRHRKTYVQAITPSDPERAASMRRGGRTAALAEGFMAYAIYMAQNYDQDCSIKHLKRRSSGGSAQKLTKIEKSRLHPKLTRAQLEAWHKAKEAIRARLNAPRTGRQFWILKHWEEITEAAASPTYNYPATLILRDGFSYTLKPDWNMEFQTCGVRSIACAFTRELVWQEIQADLHRHGLPPKSKPVYKHTGGECELDILLYLSRHRRVIQRGESPQCPVYSYKAIGGAVRPHPDNLLPRAVA